jgi:hypothetical protein
MNSFVPAHVPLPSLKFWARVFRERRVTCVLLTRGTAKIIGQTEEDARAVQADANLAQFWAKDASVRASWFGYVAPLRSSWRSRPVEPIQMRANHLCRHVGDVLTFCHQFEAPILSHLPFCYIALRLVLAFCKKVQTWIQLECRGPSNLTACTLDLKFITPSDRK